MPIKQSAKKAMRQTFKRMGHNKTVKAEIDSLRVKLRKMITEKNIEKAKELVSLISKKLDKAQGRGILKKNTVARYKSRMMKRIHALAK